MDSATANRIPDGAIAFYSEASYLANSSYPNDHSVNPTIEEWVRPIPMH